ncbi:MAG: hypothetical protein ACREGA_03810 [Candidatus Saccharimonadales bacterium]
MRYIAGFLIAIGLIVLVFVVIFKLFTGGGSPAHQAKPLVSYANTGTSVQLIIDGPVVANQNHREIKINVADDQTEISVLKGYQNTLLKTKTYPNNSSAYGVFLRALDFAGFTKGVNNSQLADYRGRCASGTTYIYQIINASGNRTQQYWANTCAGKGTFKGAATSITNLFEAQVPDYGNFTSDVNISG